MNAIGLMVHTPAAEALGKALFHFLWEGAAAALLLAIALAVVPEASSRLRYALSCGAMAAMLVAFAATWLVCLPAVTTVAPHTAFAPATGLAMVRVAASVTLDRSQPLAEYLPWLVPYWFAGVLAFYIRAAGGWWITTRLRRSGAQPAAGEWQIRLAGLAQQLRVSRPVLLLESIRVDVPMVIGYLRPAILLPASALLNLTPQQLEAVLAHELAHIRRHDYAVNLLQNLVEGLLFYHPAVWWVGRQVRAEREQCCDDLAVSVCGSAHQYAVALTTMEEARMLAPGAALAANGGQLMRRIRRLLRHPRERRPILASAVAGITIVAAIAVAMTAWAAQVQSPPPKPPAPVVQPKAPPAPPKTAPAPAGVPGGVPGVLVRDAPQSEQHDGFAIFANGDQYMNGWVNEYDLDQGKRQGKAEPFIWFRRNAKRYILRDTPSVYEALTLYPRPVFSPELVVKQEEMRAKMNELSQALNDAKWSRRDTSTMPVLSKLHDRIAELQVSISELEMSVRELQKRLDVEWNLGVLGPPGDPMDSIWKLLDQAIASGRAEAIRE
jgi:beta-lactamase regulating signal transducer with metallopeptidase domain